jgi:hypothetical protein
MALFGGHDEIVVPALFDIEVASALIRRSTCGSLRNKASRS